MAEKVILDFELNTGGSQRSIKELNDRIKQLNIQLKTADIGSKIFNQLNRELAKTKVEIQNLTKDFKDTVLQVRLDDAGSIESIETLTTRLKLLKSEIAKEEIGSENFKRLSREIATINIELKGLKEELRGLDFGAILSETGAVLSGIVGSIGLLNDVFMDGSEESEKYIQNATRTVMAIQSIGAVAAGADSAMKLLNITMEKNVIMIWVAGVAALVSGLYMLIKYLKDTNTETSTFNKLSKEQQQSIRKTNTEYTRYRLELAQTNGNLRDQIRLQEELRKEEFSEVVRQTADEFEVEEEAIRNSISAYSEYSKNQEKMDILLQDIRESRLKIKDATDAERQSLEKNIQKKLNERGVLININKNYENEYGSKAKLIEISNKMVKEEAINNGNRKKDYENTYKEIFNNARSTYESLRDAYKSMVEQLQGFDDDIKQTMTSIAKERLQQEIEDAKKLGDVEKVVKKEKLALEIDINEKIQQRLKFEQQIINTETEGQIAIKEATQKTSVANKELIGILKEVKTNNERIVKLSDQMMQYDNEIQRNRRDGIKLENIINVELQRKIDANAQLIAELEDKNVVINNEKELQYEIVKNAEQQIELYKNKASQLKTTEILQNNVKALTGEIGLLQEKQNRSQAEYIRDAILSIKQYSSQIQDEFNARKIANYEDFLTDTNKLLILSEEEKNRKVMEITGIRLGVEKKQLSDTLKDNLGQFELYLKNIDKSYKNNFDGMLDQLSKDPYLLGEVTSNINTQINQQRELILTNLNNSKVDKDVQIAKLEILDYQKSILQSIILKNKELEKISDNELLNLQSKNENIKIYQDELKKINDAIETAYQKQFEAEEKLFNKQRDRITALNELEDMKLERYEGHINKERDILLRKLEYEREISLGMAKQLYNKKILSEEQYRERVEEIHYLSNKRMEQVEIDRNKKVNEIAKALYSNLGDFITNVTNNNTNKRLNALTVETETEIQNQRERADNGIITQEQYLREKDRLEYESEQKRREIERKQANVDKATSMFQAGINTAVAITEASPNPFLMALAAATGVAQLAVIGATPIPQYELGGIVGGKRHREGGTLIEAEKDEIILKRGVRANPMLNNMASMLNESVGGRSFRIPMNTLSPISTNGNGSIDNTTIEKIVKNTIDGVRSIPVVNVATDTEKVNNKVKRLQNKAKL